jgi:hypothetical protein
MNLRAGFNELGSFNRLEIMFNISLNTEPPLIVCGPGSTLVDPASEAELSAAA